jgi:hypothetical protein
MDRNRNIAMGLVSNTYAAATLTNHIKRISLSNVYNLFITLLLIAETPIADGVI